MTRTDLGRTIAAIACTLVMSATCVLGAVGPAQSNMGPGSTATTVQRTTA